MYTDAMQQIYSSVTKVMVDSRQGNNLMYLPLDKIMQMSAGQPADLAAAAPTMPAAATTAPSAPAAAADPRARDASRTRDRDNR